MAEAALDDVFIDDITFPATDGYLLGATLFLPRGAKRHAVLINSATATPRKVYRGFAGYLARRGCAVLTYDYRGTGDSRQKAMTGYNQLKSLVGFKATMSDWAALGRHRRGGLDARALQDPAAELCRPFLRRPGAGAARQQHRGVPRPLHRGAGRLLETDGLAGALSRLCHAEFRRPAPDKTAGLCAGLGRARRRTCRKGVFEQWVGWVMSERYLFTDPKLPGLSNFANYKGALRALCLSDDPWATRPAVGLLCSGFTAIEPEILTITPADVGAAKIGHFGFFRPEHRDTLWRGAAEWIQAAE